MTRKQMHIGMSIRGLGYHPAAWRHPDVPADGSLSFEHYARSARAAERGKCDLIFFADGIGIRKALGAKRSRILFSWFRTGLPLRDHVMSRAV